MLKKTKTLLAAIVLAGAGLGASDRAFADAEADQLFSFYCAQCHGKTGDGKGPNVVEDFPVTPRAFNSAAEMNKLTDADMRNVIRDGGPVASKSPMMPPWGKTLSDAQIDKLVGKLRELCQCKGKEG